MLAYRSKSCLIVFFCFLQNFLVVFLVRFYFCLSVLVFFLRGLFFLFLGFCGFFLGFLDVTFELSVSYNLFRQSLRSKYQRQDSQKQEKACKRKNSICRNFVGNIVTESQACEI